jgi:hypothetical protein
MRIDQPKRLAIGQFEPAGGYREHLAARILRAQIKRASARCAAAGTAATHPVWRDIGMAHMNAHARRRHAQAFGNCIGHRAFVALPAGAETDRCVHDTTRLDTDPACLVS